MQKKYDGSAVSDFFGQATEVLGRLQEVNADTLSLAVPEAGARLMNGGRFLTFGAGHSGLVAQDIYYRAGGLKSTECLFEDRLMLDFEPIEQTSAAEKTEGLLDASLRTPGLIGENDILIVISTSGVNAVPVDVALAGIEAGAHVIAVTSRAASERLEPRHSSGLRLQDSAHQVLDNLAPYGDTLQEVGDGTAKMGSASTAAGALLLQALTLGAADWAIAQGWEPAIYVSGNIPGGMEQNAG
jgi:uncharacterized phosphosugar-binding protein